jgi:hypothetical protein
MVTRPAAMNVVPQIQSLEGVRRHADRVVAEMLRHMARTHADISTAINEVIKNASDGTPKGQRKMEARVKAAGAWKTFLTPGTYLSARVLFHYGPRIAVPRPRRPGERRRSPAIGFPMV